MELYARVRRAVLVEGKSRRAVAREFGLARKTIEKMLEYSLPPGYRRQSRCDGPSSVRGRASSTPLLKETSSSRRSSGTPPSGSSTACAMSISTPAATPS